MDRRAAQVLPGHEGWDGKERREYPHRYRKIHPWRWRALTIWIVLFTAAVAWAIGGLDRTSAKVKDLEDTNCNTKVFLLTAAQRNQLAADEPTNSTEERQANRAAAKAYIVLANNFGAVGECPKAERLTQQLNEGG